MPQTIQIANPAPGTVIPSNKVVDLVAILRGLFSLGGADTSSVDNSFAQASIPSTSQQNQTWIRLSADTAGKPLGAYRFYQGRWCRSYALPVGAMIYTRINPTGLFNLTTGLGVFDSGTPGLAGEWYGWRLNLAGTGTSLQDRFLISANKFDTTQNKYVTQLTDGTLVERGGRSGANLPASQIPSLPITGRVYDSTVADGPVRVVVSTKTSGNDLASDVSTSGYINGSQAQLSAYGPFVAAGLLEFLGYTYLDPTVPLP